MRKLGESDDFDLCGNDYSFTTVVLEAPKQNALSLARLMAPCPDHSGAEAVVAHPASRNAGRNVVSLECSNCKNLPHLEIQAAAESESKAGVVHEVWSNIHAADG